MTPAAVIPVHTPEEAIAEREFCTRQLGSKAAMFGSLVPRPVPSINGADDEISRFAVWYDPLGLDSQYDDDPVWAKCLELGVAKAAAAVLADAPKVAATRSDRKLGGPPRPPQSPGARTRR